jgi:hypothetical protein
MELKFEVAEALRDSVNNKLGDRGLKSYSKVISLKSTEGLYDVRIVLHPDEGSLPSEFPGGLDFVPWAEQTGEQYIERTPRTPSKRDAPYDDWYPTTTRRRHEPSTHYPDTNPFYPGLRRVPEIQDLVRRVAMKASLQKRLVRVDHMLVIAGRLAKFARGHARHKESEYLVEELTGFLKNEGYTGRHKCLRLVNKLRKAMKADGYVFEKA